MAFTTSDDPAPLPQYYHVDFVYPPGTPPPLAAEHSWTQAAAAVEKLRETLRDAQAEMRAAVESLGNPATAIPVVGQMGQYLPPDASAPRAAVITALLPDHLLVGGGVVARVLVFARDALDDPFAGYRACAVTTTPTPGAWSPLPAPAAPPATILESTVSELRAVSQRLAITVTLGGGMEGL